MAKYRRKKAAARDRRPVFELWGVVLIIIGAIGFLSVLTETAGIAGGFVAHWLSLLFGRGARAVPAIPLLWGLAMTASGKPVKPTWRMFGVGLFLYLVLMGLHLATPPGYEFDEVEMRVGGGALGAAGAWLLAMAFGTVGRLVVMGGLGVLAALSVTKLSPGRALGLLVVGARLGLEAMARQIRDFLGALKSRRSEKQVSGGRPSFRETQDGRLVRADRPSRRQTGAGGEAAESHPAGTGQPAPAGGPGTLGTTTPVPAAAQGALDPRPSEGQIATRPGAPVPVPVPQGGSGGSGAGSAPGRAATPLITVAAAAAGATPPARPYVLPSLTLLRRGPKQRTGRAAQDAETRAQLLEETFSSFGVGVKVMEINPGPTVTRFEVRPAPGVKVSKIESLADDIALSLAAADVRIAPIPGKGLIGVEVPNAEVSVVYLREVLESAEFARAPGRLTFAVGKDIAGQVILADLEKLLHLLIAGATGSGKSVCLNAMIASILFKASPDDVKLLLIDPKVVEFQVFDGIPHLLAPVINDPKKASQVLRWAVKEMLDRYFRFSEYGVRNIGDYNRLMAELAEAEAQEAEAQDGGTGGKPLAQPPSTLPSAKAPNGATVTDAHNTPLPHIVIVIDELADLMMVAPVEVEDSIWRLAQMARAAGIHLVVATQRPSVNVITGVIKANIPSRIAFAVASQVDARTILDMSGAEKLLGRGDMLYYPVGASKPLRVQGALISDREVEELVNHVKRQANPNYMDSFPVPDDAGQGTSRDMDEKWGDALRVVFEGGQASTSMLQRRLRIGYTRAARMVDMMEEMGIVAKSDGVKPRDVLMTMEQYVERHGPPDGGGDPLRR